jgi:hypothetical protein
MIKAELGENIGLYENKCIHLKDLPPRLQALRPDMWFLYIEVTVAFATRTNNNRNTPKAAYDFKKDRYKDLREEIHAITGERVIRTTVVVSSLGAVLPDPMKALARLLRTKDAAQFGKYGRRISLTALEGSLEIWRKFNAHNAVKSMTAKR